MSEEALGRGHRRGPKSMSDTLWNMYNSLKPYRIPIIASLIFAVLGTLMTVAGPMLIGRATTAIATGIAEKIAGTGGIDFNAIQKIAMILIGLYIASGVFSYLQGYIMVGVAQKISFSFRQQLSEKINRLPLSYFDKTSHGDVLSRVTNDVDTLAQTLNESLAQIVTNFTTIVGVAIMMLLINGWLTLIAVLVIPISFFIVSFILKHSQQYFANRQKYLGTVNGQVEEVYGGHVVLKAFNAEAYALEDFEVENKKLHEVTWKAQFFSGIIRPVMTFVSNLGYVAVSIAGSYFVILGKLDIGNILAFIQYVRRFQQPINQTAELANTFQSSIAAAERIFEFLEEEEEVEEAKNPVKPNGIKGNVSFNNITFGYNPEEPVINNFTVDVKQGQQVAIVGPTGAGKTTIVKLLMRFYDVDKGSITIDGIDIRDFTRKDLRDQIGMVLQDTWLFNDTIMENIRYSRIDATDEEVIEAAKLANAHHFIKTLPGGYEMVINEDASNLSQGQKQLLTIARAMLSDSNIMILDEATSSIDTRTELIIQKALDNLMEGKTSFVIAHRLSTIRDADWVLVLKDGDIIEQGTHISLLEDDGFYAELYRSQFETVDIA